MIVNVDTVIQKFYLVANVGSVPYTKAASSGAPYYFAFIEVEPRKTYTVKTHTAFTTFRAATFGAIPTAASVNGVKTLCESQSSPAIGYGFSFVADDNEHFLVIYGASVSYYSVEPPSIDLEEVVPHNYSSVEEIIQSGTSQMLTLVNNTAYDDNAFSVTPPSWLKFNGVSPTTLYASGNTWFGIGSTTEHIKFNRRDTKMYYLYREEGTIYNAIRFLKLRWRGYSVYNQTGSSYLQEWEVIFFDTGDFMIHAVTIPTSSYNGTFQVIAAQTYTYTAPTNANPYASFYTQDADNTTFRLDYGIIELAPWCDKWLIEDGGTFYNTADGALNPLSITEVTAQNMLAYGNDEIPDGALLLLLTNPTLHRWNDSDSYIQQGKQPTIAAAVDAYPFPQTLECPVDMSHSSIKGIKSVMANYSGTLQIKYSTDGETFTEYMPLADFLALDFSEIYESLPEPKILYLILRFSRDAVLTNITFNYIK